MSLEPTGVFALPLRYAALTLAASATFQALVGVPDADSALNKIVIGELDEHDPAHQKPRALLSVAGDRHSDKVTTTGWLRGGMLELVYEVPIPPDYLGSPRTARLWFDNQLGAIQIDIEALAGTGGFLNITAMREINTGRADPDQNAATGTDRDEGDDVALTDSDQFFVSVWNLTYLG